MLMIDVVILGLLAYGVVTFLHYKEAEEQQKQNN